MARNILSGTWKLSVSVGDKSGVATFEFVEGEGGTLSGTYTGVVGSAKVSGTVEGDNVAFSFDWHAGKVKYKGTRVGDKLSGTCIYGTVGEGTFEGRRADD